MSEPKIGMNYSDVAKRIKRIKSSPMHLQSKLNLIHSLSNQCRLAEGESSLKELARDCAFNKTGSTFSGAGNKQTGFGPGRFWSKAEYIANGYKEISIGKWIKQY